MNLAPDSMLQLKEVIEKDHPTQRELETKMGDDILRKIAIGSYQGIRHTMALPVRGQRNNVNAKTQRKLGLRRAAMFGFKVEPPKIRKS